MKLFYTLEIRIEQIVNRRIFDRESLDRATCDIRETIRIFVGISATVIDRGDHD